MTTSSTPRPQTNPESGPSRILTAVQAGLAYNVEPITPTSRQNAHEGLCNGKMTMVRCHERDEDYHFELQERIHVTVSEGEAPTCSSCSNHGGRACRHIWWVDDQILNTYVPSYERPRSQYEISRDGQAVCKHEEKDRLMFYDYLEGRGLEKLAQLGDWWIQDPSDRQDVELVEETAVSILSAFEPCGILSEQHSQNRLEMLQRESQALFARYRSEMIKQVKSQPFLLIALGAAVPEAERDHLHLAKIHSRIERTFFDFGHWIVARMPNDSGLDATAAALRTEIGHLHSFIQARHDKMAAFLKGRIVNILLHTLEQLVVHAEDVYDNTAVTTPQYSGLSVQDRNLLHKMIDRKSQSVFVLDVLRLLGPQALHDEVVQDRAERLADGLRYRSAPEVFVQFLESIVGL